MDASRIQSHQHDADYSYSNDRGTPPSQRPYRPLHPGGQPLAQSASGASAHGTQAQVFEMLKARTAALSAIENEALRTSAFEALLASVSGHDEQQRAGAIHLLLAQLPGLPEESRGDALSNLLLLCADVPDAERPGLYAALAQSVSCLPAPHRSAALREIAVGTRGIAAQERARPLLAIAQALSTLPDAQAQKTVHQLARRLCEGAPAPAQMAAMEALARVDWLDPGLALDSANTSLQALPQIPDASSAQLLILLADGLPKMPEARRTELFETLLARTGKLAAMELAGVMQMLRHAVTHIPSHQRAAARDAVERTGVPADPGAGSATPTPQPQASAPQVLPMDRSAFLQAVSDSEKRSPANRASALLALAASLDLLPQDERQAPFDALLDAAGRLRALQRGPVLERLALEIGQLPEPSRAAAWTSLIELADELPDQVQVPVLITLCAAVADLPKAQREEAPFLLATQAVGLVEPSGPLGAALAGIIASLPKASRMAGFETMLEHLDRMVARTRFSLGIALTDTLPDLPSDQRSAAAAMLLSGTTRWPVKHRFTALLRLANMLPWLPEETMGNTIGLLCESLGRERCIATLKPEPQASEQKPATEASNSPKTAEVTPLPEPDRATILCAIGASLSSLATSHPCYRYGVWLTLQSAVALPVQQWTAVLQSVVPGLLNGDLPAQPKPLMGMDKYVVDRFIVAKPAFRTNAVEASGPVQLVLDLCEILRSSETDHIKDLMLRPSEKMRQAFFYASSKATPVSHNTYFSTSSPSEYFLAQLVGWKPATAHHVAAFLVPLLASKLDEETVLRHVLARTTPKADGQWRDGLSELFWANLESSGVYRSMLRTALSLVFGSGLSPEAKYTAGSCVSYYKETGPTSLFQTLAQTGIVFGGLDDDHARVYVGEIATSGLPPELATRLLAGLVTSDKMAEKTGFSTALWIAIKNDRTHFLQHYAEYVASARLPEASKLALLSGSGLESKGAQTEIQKMRGCNNTTFKFYRELIATLPLAETSKQTLLELFQ